MQDMVDAIELPYSFDGHDILRLLHNTNGIMVTARIAANRTGVFLRIVATNLAILDGSSGFNQGVSKLSYLFLWKIQNIKGQPLRCLVTDTWKLREFFDKLLYCYWIEILSFTSFRTSQAFLL